MPPLRTASAVRRRASSRPSPFQLEPLEPRVLLTAATVADAAVQTQLGVVFSQMEGMGTALSVDARATTAVPLLNLSANQLLPGIEFGDFMKGFGTAATTYFAGDATDTSAELAAALDAYADGKFGAGTYVTDGTVGNNFALNFNFTSVTNTRNVAIDLGAGGEDLSMTLENGLTVSLTSQADVQFKVEADLADNTLLGDSKFWLTPNTYNISGTVAVTGANNFDFGAKFGALGGKLTASAGPQTGFGTEGAWVNNATLDWNLKVFNSFNDVTADTRRTIAEVKTLSSNGTAYASAVSTSAPVAALQNQMRLEMPVEVTASTFGGLNGIAANIVLTDASLMDGAGPQIDPSSVGVDTLRNFGRFTPEVMLSLLSQYGDWSKLLSASSLYDSKLPYTDTRLGDVFDFNKAFESVFLSQLQTSENVLLAQLAPSGLTGTVTFLIGMNTTSPALSVTVTNPGTFSNLVTQLDTAVSTATSSKVRVRAKVGEIDRIEFYSASADAFAIVGIKDAADTLNLGFDPYNRVSATAPNAVTGTVLPEVVISATDATVSVNTGSDTFTLTDHGLTNGTRISFAGTTMPGGITAGTRYYVVGSAANTFQVSENFGGTAVDLTSGGSSVRYLNYDFSSTATQFAVTINRPSGNLTQTVTLAAVDYQSLQGLQLAIRRALIDVGLLTESNPDAGTPERGVTTIINSSGRLEFVALEDTWQVTLQDVGAHGGSLGRLNIANNATATAQYLDVATNGGAATRVYLNGNLTSGKVNSVNKLLTDNGIEDLVKDLRQALKWFNVQNGNSSSGIDVRASGGKLEFFAVKPGGDTGEVSSFTVAASSGIQSTLGLAAATLTSTQLTLASKVGTPSFTTLQELAGLLSTKGFLTGQAQYVKRVSPDPNPTQEIYFPVAFSLSLDPVTGKFSPGSTLGELTNVETASSVTINPQVTVDFDFGFKMDPVVGATQTLTVAPPVGYVDPAGYDLTVDLRDGYVALNNWNGKLSGNAEFKIQLDDGVEHTVTVLQSATTDNSSLSDLKDDINAAIRTVAGLLNGAASFANQTVQAFVVTSPRADTSDRIELRSNPAKTSSDSLSVRTSASFTANINNAMVSTLGFVNDSGQVASATGSSNIPANGQLTTDLVLTLTYQNGAPIQVTVRAADTLDNSSRQDLIDDINYEIRNASAAAMFGGFGYDYQIVQAGVSSNKLTFTLNADANVIRGATWLRIQAANQYVQTTANAARADLGFRADSYAETTSDILRVTAADGDKIQAAAYNITADGNAVFQVSLDSGAWTTVTVTAANFGNMAGMLTAINSALGTAGLGTKVKAVQFGQSSQVALKVIDSTVNTIRFKAASANPSVTRLGFEDTTLFARRIGIQSFIDNATFDAKATISAAPVGVKANLGMVGFQSGAGSVLDVIANTRVRLEDSVANRRFDMNTLGMAMVEARPGDVARLGTINGTGVAANDSMARLTLDTLTLTGAAVTGLSFGTNPKMVLDLQTRNGTSLQPIDLNNLNWVEPTYTNLNGVDRLARLTFDDVVMALQAVSGSLSDFMAHTPVGIPSTIFDAKLPFINDSLLQLVDFGREFGSLIDSVKASPPLSLQELESRLELGLGLDASALSLGFVTVGNEITLNINADWVQNFFDSLPLYIDMGKLGDAWGNSPLVAQELSIAALATGYNNLLVNLSALARLSLDMGIKITDTAGTKLTPTPFLYDSTRLDVDVALSAPNLNFDIPVGAATLRIINGSAAVNRDGSLLQLDSNGIQHIIDPAAFDRTITANNQTARVATTLPLAATYNNGAGTLTSTALESLNAAGIDGITSLVVGDQVLVSVQSQGESSSVKDAQNGLYQVTSLGAAGVSSWVLTRVASADTVGELSNLVVAVSQGATYGGMRFRQMSPLTTLGTSTVTFARLVDPMSMSLDVVGNQALPWVVKLATTANLAATYNNGSFGVGATLTASANGSMDDLSIDGYRGLLAGDRILVKNQTTQSHNGIYLVKNLGSATTPWVLERADFADSVAEITNMRVSVEGGQINDGSVNEGVRFIQTQTPSNLGGTSDHLIFSNSKTTVFGGFAVTTATGEATTIDPIKVTTRNTRNEEVAVNLGSLVISINNDQPTSVTVNAGTNRIQLASNPYANGQKVVFTGQSAPGGISFDTTYFVVNSTASDFQLATSLGGTAIDLTSAGTNVGIYVSGMQRYLDQVSFPPKRILGTTSPPVTVNPLSAVVAVNDLTNEIGLAAHGLASGTRIYFTGDSAPGGLTLGATYTVVNPTANTFQVWNPATAAVVDITSPGANVKVNVDSITWTAHGLANGTAIMIDNATTSVVPGGLRTYQTYYVINADTNTFQLSYTRNGPPVDITSAGSNVRFQTGFFYTVNFENLPPVADNIPDSDILRLLRDPVMVADSMDLSLFDLQFALDMKTGERMPLTGTQLTDATQYIENFRARLTAALRNNLRGEDNPINAVRDTLWSILGSDPGGMGYLTGTKNTAITAKTVDSVGVASVWDWSADHDSDNDGVDEAPSSATAVQFELSLRKKFAEFTIDDVDLAVPYTGLNVSPVGDNRGVTIQSYFEFDWGFGVSLTDGFYFLENADGNAATPDVRLSFAAVLDGSLSTVGIQDFAQTTFAGSMYDLTVKAKDNKGVPLTFNLGDGTIFTGNSGFYGRYNLNLNDGDTSGTTSSKRWTVTEQYGKRPDQMVNLTLNADADINLNLHTKHSVAADITLDWCLDWRYGSGYTGGTGTDVYSTMPMTGGAGFVPDASSYWQDANDDGVYQAGENTGRLLGPKVDMININVDLTTAFGSVFKPMFDFINSAMAPFDPMLDFLTTEIPFIDYVIGRSFTVVDLAAAFGYVNPSALAAIKALDFIRGLVNNAVSEVNIQTYADNDPSASNKARNGVSIGASRGVGIPLKGSLLTGPKSSMDFDSKSRSDKAKSTESWDKYKQAAADAKGDSNASKVKAVAGMKGGGMYLGIFDPKETVRLLLGEQANLVLIDLPKFSFGLTFEKRFPVPPAPVLQGKLFASITGFVDLGFGWDTQGFYMSDIGNDGLLPSAGTSTAGLKDVSEFGLTFTIGIGGSVNLAVVEAGIEASFTVDALIDWNDPNHDGKIRESEREILRSLPGGRWNEIDIDIIGSFDVVIYVDVFAIFDWTRVFEYHFGPWEVFHEQFYGNDPVAVPATLNGTTLTINIGPHASARIFPDIRDMWEKVLIEHVADNANGGEDVRVTLQFLPGNPSAVYSGVKKVVAYGGAYDDVIDARSLTRAVVDFDGGDGNDILYAGLAASLVTSANPNILRGGAGNDKIYGSQKWDLLFGGSGNDLLVAYDQTNPTVDVADTLQGDAGSDTLDGGYGADTYLFQNGWGRDRITEQTDTVANRMDFSAVTTNIEFNLGRILYSATSGANVAFADPGRFNRVDSGSGSDRINVTHFFPHTLTIDGRNGSDFYAINLGDQNPPNNPGAGAVNLTDTGTNGTDTLLLLPTRADEFNASLSVVQNGRESMANSGLERFLIDAGGFTIRLGNSASTDSWADLGEQSVVTAGRIKLLSNIEAGSINWDLTKGIAVDHHINARNNGSIRINVQNPDPGYISVFELGSSVSPLNSGPVRITSSPGSVFASTPRIVIPGTSSAYIPEISYVWVFLPLYGWYPLYNTYVGAMQVTGLQGLTHESILGYSGYPAINLPGRSAISVPHWGVNAGGTALELKYDVIPAVAAINLTSTQGVGGTSLLNGTTNSELAAVADQYIPGVASQYVWIGGLYHFIPGRSGVYIPGRAEIVIPPTPLAVQNGSVAPVGDMLRYIIPANQNGNGTGLIKLTNYNGSIFNTPGTFGGSLEARNGSISLDAKFSIGQAASRILVNSSRLAGVSRDAAVGGNIFLKSNSDVNIVTVDGLQGMETAFGDIDILLDSGRTLYAERIKAGGSAGTGGNITLAADEINFKTQSSYSTWRWWYSWPWYWTVTPVTVVYDIQPIEGVTITMMPVSADREIRVGQNAPLLPDGTRNLAAEVASPELDLTGDVWNGSIWVRGDLSALKDGFTRVTIGRNDTLAGRVNVYGETLRDTTTLRGSEVNVLDDTQALTVQGSLDLITIASAGTGNGNITIVAGALPVTVQGTAWQSVNNININRALTLGATVGTVAMTAGTDGSGTITVDAAVTASAVGSQMNLTSGGTSGSLLINQNVTVEDLVSLTALGGPITVANTARVTTRDLVTQSLTASLLYTAAVTVDAQVLGLGNLTVNELNGITLTRLTTANGDIAVNAAGAVLTGDIHTQEGGVDRAGDVTLITTVGGITRSTDDIEANLLTATAAGSIDVLTRVASLDASVTGAGFLTVSEFDSLILTDLDTANGAISVTANQSLDARDVQSLTNSDANDITLTTLFPNGGTITVDLINAGSLGDVTLLADGAVLENGAGTGWITADQLIVDAGGAVTLDTQANEADVRSSAAGNIVINEKDSLTLSDLRAADLRGIEANAGDIYVNTGQSLTLSAGLYTPVPYDLYLNTGLDPVLGGGINHVSGTAAGDRLTVNAEGAVTIQTTVANVFVTTTANGNVTITETDSVTFDSVLALNGNVVLNVGSAGTGGNATLNTVTAGTGGTLGNVTLDVFGNITQTTGKVTGATLTVDARGFATLLTNVNTLDIDTLLAGDIDITEDAGIFVNNASSFNGDIIIRDLAGSITVNQINAAGGTDNVTLRATAGSIEENTPQDAGVDITGNNLVLLALNGIGATSPIETTVVTLNAQSTGGGNIGINETNDLLLDLVSTTGDFTLNITSGNLGQVGNAGPDLIA
ncbi:MAG: hypothetical protein SFY92_03795, partial [Verrucomicrobiae bacterium]|nr:hypothetical protein [Verrucomicrobiae bacterium]